MILRGIVTFMRIVYPLTFLEPLIVYRETRNRSLGMLVVFAPLALIAYLAIGAVTGVGLSLFSWALDLVTQFNLFSPISTRRLLLHPGKRLVYNAQFYASHMVHWGIPYWTRLLMNPFLHVLGFAGVAIVARRTVRVGLAAGVAVAGFWIDFLQCEILPSSGRLPTFTFLLLIGGYSLLIYLAHLDQSTSLGPSLLASAYFFTMLFFPRSDRYFLPVILTLTRYAGVTIDTLATAAIDYSRSSR